MRSVPDLFDKLWTLFEIFFYYNIFIKHTKSYLNYLNIALFGQRVNSLGLTTLKEQLKVIHLLTFLDTLDSLKYFLDLTGYLQSYIYFYTQIAVPL